MPPVTLMCYKCSANLHNLTEENSLRTDKEKYIQIGGTLKIICTG